MFIRQPSNKRDPSIKTYPLQKSHSAAAIIIYGEKNSNDYTDSLMSYKKNFATLDKQRRQQQMNRKNKAIQGRKQDNLIRQINAKQNQQRARKKLYQRQNRAQQLYHNGQLKNTLTNSLPVNPLSSQIHNNMRGKSLAAIDQQKGLNRMVRAHYLQTLGNSGYNIINGRSSIDFNNIVPVNKNQAFQQKLFKLYSKFKLNPE